MTSPYLFSLNTNFIDLPETEQNATGLDNPFIFSSEFERNNLIRIFLYKNIYNDKTLKYKFFDPSVSSTIGGESTSSRFISIVDTNRITQKAKELINNINNDISAKKVREIINSIEHVISNEWIEDINYNLPPLNANILEDGAILIEWIFPDIRIGFNIEENIDESGWYIISDDKFGNVAASGFLPDENLNKLVSKLYNFISL